MEDLNQYDSGITTADGVYTMRVEMIMTTQRFYGYQAMIRLEGNVIRAGECVADPAEAAFEGNNILAEYGGNEQEGLPW